MNRSIRALLQFAVAFVLCLPLLLGLAGLAAAWLSPAHDVWPHLRTYVLPDAAADTALLLIAVGAGCALLGTTGAWLNARCEYPGRRFFDWALLLPLALPSYVVAFVAIGLLGYAGPVQTLWREVSGSQQALWTPHGLGWAAAVLSLCFYPYVYLTVRAVLLRQSDRHVDVARTLGLSPWRAFWRVRLPLIRPALVAGLSLAMLETLAEFGAVSLLGVDTLTTAVYKTWFGLYSLPAAAQLASIGLAAAAVLLFVEANARARRRQHEGPMQPPARMRLGRGAAIAAVSMQTLLLTLAFVVPVVQLLGWASVGAGRGAADLQALANTVKLGAAGAVLLVAAGLLAVWLRRVSRAWPAGALTSLASMGYGIPGTVLAAGLLLSLLAIEAQAADLGFRIALTGNLIALLVALQVRFLRAATGPLAAGAGQITPSLLDAARSLGASRWRIFATVTIPLLRPSIFAALLLVAIEVMKEMPATLMLRPFGWDTLAVRIYALTAEGMWHEAALPALALVAAGLLPIWWLVRLGEREPGAGSR